jgi:hypothetical protein
MKLRHELQTDRKSKDSHRSNAIEDIVNTVAGFYVRAGGDPKLHTR